MADVIFPPHVTVARTRFRYRNAVGENRMLYTGLPETTGYGGDRYMANIEVEDLGGRDADGQAELAAFLAWLNSLEGKVNRSWLWDHTYKRRGAFPAVELLTNPTFEQGTTGWNAVNSALSVQDRVLRIKSIIAGVAGSEPQANQQPAVTPHVPYVSRGMFLQGRGPAFSGGVALNSVGTTQTNDYSVAGLRTAVHVPASSPITASLVSLAVNQIAGDHVDVPYASLSRCLLVDVGVNLLLQSDEFDATWAPTAAGVNDQIISAPDGTITADSIEEDGTPSANHYIAQSVTVAAAAADYSFSVSLRAGSRNWAALFLRESVSGHDIQAYINLSTGAIGTVAAVGANWSNARAHVVSQGDGWYRLWITGRKLSAATTLTAFILIAEADNDTLFNGLSAVSMYAWRATLAQSSVPTRPVLTTTAATTGASPTGGTIHVKGGRSPSEGALAGALLMNDRAELITSRGSQLTHARTSLDLDAAGTGTLLVSAPLRGAMLDNAPIILHQPMGRFLFAGETPEWDNESVFTRASLPFEEAGDA